MHTEPCCLEKMHRYSDSHCVCKGSHTEGMQKVRVTHSPAPFSGWLSLRIADRTAHTIQNSFLSCNVWMAAVSNGACVLSAPRLQPHGRAQVSLPPALAMLSREHTLPLPQARSVSEARHMVPRLHFLDEQLSSLTALGSC